MNGLYRYLSIKSVAHATDRFEEGCICIGIELLAKILHMYIKHVRESREVEAPHMVEDALACQGLVWMTHEVLEQRVFLQGELYGLAALGDGARARVEFDVAHGHERRQTLFRPSEHRVDARDQLFKGERLREVVIGARVEEFYLVFSLIARGEDDNRRLHAFLACLAGDGRAVYAREHEVEHDEVVLLAVEEDAGLCLFTLGNPVDGK